jgi:hypothetical protein
MGKEAIVLDFEKVSTASVVKFRKAVSENKSSEALRHIRSAIISVDGGAFTLEGLASKKANLILGTILTELTELLENVAVGDTLIDLNGWYVSDQDDYYNAIAKNNFSELNRLWAMVVKAGPGVSTTGSWVGDTAKMSFEDFIRINRAINAEISNSFSEGN